MDKTFLVGIYVVVGIYIFYRIFFRKNKFSDEYEKTYNKILNSDEYKVKGQYDEK